MNRYFCAIEATQAQVQFGKRLEQRGVVLGGAYSCEILRLFIVFMVKCTLLTRRLRMEAGFLP